MPRVSLKKIKSALKASPIYTRVGLLLLLAVLLVSGLIFLRQSNTNTVLRAKNQDFYLETVSSEASQQKGLSGRSLLAPEAGMLFLYTSSTERCFWMKDMRFPIDIIWADANRRITRIEPKLSPDTYPQSYCADAQYVIELPAGSAAKNGLQAGRQLSF